MDRVVVGFGFWIFVGIVSLAAPAAAQDVDLSDATADEVKGEIKVNVKDAVRCLNERLDLDFTFADDGRSFVVVDQRGDSYSGTYRQKDPDGRKLVFKLDDASQQDLADEWSRNIAVCTGVCEDGKARLKSMELTGKVTKSLEKLKIDWAFRGRNRACDQKYDGTFRWTGKGPLTLE
ncbi:MAG: hypothetical protein ACQGVK_09785 [Myxococcota bacterium]